MAVSGFTPVYSQTSTTRTNDSIEISLLTCSPHDAIYSLYGHTAIRYKDLTTGGDWVFNYGVFNFRKPFFVLRFVFGKTDYELGVVPFHIFQKEYERFGCQVNEQVLNITHEEKMKIINALEENYRPENKVYRYNFFYNNCTTQARDIIAKSITGDIVYKKINNEKKSFRDEIHDYTENYPWASFGNDLCLGFKADKTMTLVESQFLPENLMRDFDNAQIVYDGKTKPLVKSNQIILKSNTNEASVTIFRPVLCAYIFLIITFVISFKEYRRRKTSIVFDVFTMLITGMAGIVVLALLFSEHPTTSTNLQILILNPISLLFIPTVIKKKKNSYWHIYEAAIVLFLIGSVFQDYAEGMTIVALSLLIRSWMHTRIMTKSA